MSSGLPQTKPICLPAGRYEFRDAGVYIGEWLDEKAVGLGLITKDKCQGEYTGLWVNGSEKSGVFLWPNAPGAMYEGEWASNRRNGFGVFSREDWLIMGRFEDDFIAEGVKGKENSLGKFEGTFENGFPTFGVETYADGGMYAGDYKNGIREGFGVRTSIPYRDVLEIYPEVKATSNSLKCEVQQKLDRSTKANSLPRRRSLLSQRSGDVAGSMQLEIRGREDMFMEAEPITSSRKRQLHPVSTENEIRLMKARFKCGFVLTAQKSDLLVRRLKKLRTPRSNIFGCANASAIGKKTHSSTNLFTYPHDLDTVSSFDCIKPAKHLMGSIHSSPNNTLGSTFANTDDLGLDLIGDDTVEVYSGAWKADARHGFGMCRRTDGVAYVGQWFKNQRHGLGQTRFRDGTYEQGRYMNGSLMFLALPAGNKPHSILYNYHILKEVHIAIERAISASDLAKSEAKKAREQVSEKIHDYVEKAMTAAMTAREFSLEARELVKEMYPDFDQPGMKYLEDIVRLMHVTKCGSSTFESAAKSAKEVLSGRLHCLAGSDQVYEESEEETPTEDLTLPPKFSSQSIGQNKPGRQHISRSSSLRRHPLKARTLYQRKKDPAKPTSSVTQAPNSSTGVEIESKKSSECNDSCLFSELRGLSHFTPDNSLRDPTQRMLYNENLNDTQHSLQHPINNEEIDKVSISSSTSSIYVNFPDIYELQPYTDVPSFPLKKLLANPVIFSNHFDHYRCEASTMRREIEASNFSPKSPKTEIKTLTNKIKEFRRYMGVMKGPVQRLRASIMHIKPILEVRTTQLLTKNSSTPNFQNQLSSEKVDFGINSVIDTSFPFNEISGYKNNAPSLTREVYAWLRVNLPILAIIVVNIFIIYIYLKHLQDVNE